MYLGISGWGSFGVEGFDSCLVIPDWGGLIPACLVPGWGGFAEAHTAALAIGDLQPQADPPNGARSAKARPG
jgi:hypothetical protein